MKMMISKKKMMKIKKIYQKKNQINLNQDIKDHTKLQMTKKEEQVKMDKKMLNVNNNEKKNESQKSLNYKHFKLKHIYLIYFVVSI